MKIPTILSGFSFFKIFLKVSLIFNFNLNFVSDFNEYSFKINLKVSEKYERKMVISKTLVLTKDKYYETHLFIINGVLPIRLTPMEITVLAAFMALEGDLISNNRFCTSARKLIKEKLSLSDGGLGNYIKSFRDKKVIIESNDEIEIIRPQLIPDYNEQQYNFKLIKSKHEN